MQKNTSYTHSSLEQVKCTVPVPLTPRASASYSVDSYRLLPKPLMLRKISAARISQNSSPGYKMQSTFQIWDRDMMAALDMDCCKAAGAPGKQTEMNRKSNRRLRNTADAQEVTKKHCDGTNQLKLSLAQKPQRAASIQNQLVVACISRTLLAS